MYFDEQNLTLFIRRLTQPPSAIHMPTTYCFVARGKRSNIPHEVSDILFLSFCHTDQRAFVKIDFMWFFPNRTNGW